MNCLPLTQTLAESFSALADEVQSLIDRKTILEHKLKYAHEQFQYLADKYAPAVPEITETLAKLQLPPELHSSFAAADAHARAQAQPLVVPLPKRGPFIDTRHQVALLIRAGKRAANQLSSMAAMAAAAAAAADESKTSGSSKNTSLVSPGPATMTAPSTVLEQDFTVEGKKQGPLACPFSALRRDSAPGAYGAPGAPGVDGTNGGEEGAGAADPTPHHSSDPICAAMYEQAMLSPAPAGAASAAKCPIRFLDQHSPEEIAHYVETHKHEIPRSHEICVRRYQRSEEQIRKLDAKYGNLAHMIQDLSQLHKSMLPESAAGGPGGGDDGRVGVGGADKAASDKGPLRQAEVEAAEAEADKTSAKRVASWAQDVSTADPDFEEVEAAAEAPPLTDEDRLSHFDRPLRDVRVGESPSRPWGISVPMYAPAGQPEQDRPESPPPVPVRMPSPLRSPHTQEPAAAAAVTVEDEDQDQEQEQEEPKPERKTCPFGFGTGSPPSFLNLKREEASTTQHENGPAGGGGGGVATERPLSPVKNEHQAQAQPRARSPSPPRPVFINPFELPLPKAEKAEKGDTPQIVFNISGPVFIGYPMEQAMQFMQQFQGQQR